MSEGGGEGGRGRGRAAEGEENSSNALFLTRMKAREGDSKGREGRIVMRIRRNRKREEEQRFVR